MPAPPNPAPLPSLALVLAMSAVLAGMLLAWHAALSRLFRGEPLLPPRPPRWVPWGASAVGVTILLYVLLSNAVSTGFLISAGKGALKNPTHQLGAMAIINAGLILLLPPVLRLLAGARAADLGLAEVSWPNLRLGVAGCLLAAAPTYILFGLATRIWPRQDHPMQQMIGDGAGPGVTLLAVLSGVILAPMAEELVFRGVLQGWLTRLFARRKPAMILVGDEVGDEGWFRTFPRAPGGKSILSEPGPLAGWMPNLITSVCFAALHWGQWPAPIPLFALSLGLGWLARRSGGIVAPIAMHATFNGLSTAMLLLATWAGYGTPPAPAREAVPPPAQAAENSIMNSPWRCRWIAVNFRTLSHPAASTPTSPTPADGIGFRDSAVCATGRPPVTPGPRSVDESRPPAAP